MRGPRVRLLVAHSPGGQLAARDWVDADEDVRARGLLSRRGTRSRGCRRGGELW